MSTNQVLSRFRPPNRIGVAALDSTNVCRAQHPLGPRNQLPLLREGLCWHPPTKYFPDSGLHRIGVANRRPGCPFLLVRRESLASTSAANSRLGSVLSITCRPSIHWFDEDCSCWPPPTLRIPDYDRCY